MRSLPDTRAIDTRQHRCAILVHQFESQVVDYTWVEQAATVAACSDGVVVGSAIVKIVAANGDQPDLADKVFDFVKPLVDATKSV